MRSQGALSALEARRPRRRQLRVAGSNPVLFIVVMGEPGLERIATTGAQITRKRLRREDLFRGAFEIKNEFQGVLDVSASAEAVHVAPNEFGEVVAERITVCLDIAGDVGGDAEVRIGHVPGIDHVDQHQDLLAGRVYEDVPWRVVHPAILQNERLVVDLKYVPIVERDGWYGSAMIGASPQNGRGVLVSDGRDRAR